MLREEGDERAGRTAARIVNLDYDRKYTPEHVLRARELGIDPAQADPTGFDCIAGETSWCALKARGGCECARLPDRTPTDDERTTSILETMRVIDPHVATLLDGDWEGRYPSRSEADMGAAALLRHRYRLDAETIVRVLRKSGLYRPKFDERRGSTTYVGYTVAKVVASEASR